ncbi:hypothetical protein CRUP_001782 [Coryphaenoides rupestris]|nr:hypothetical protein CRUP_001782 [Coryphaenoides rupestris]
MGLSVWICVLCSVLRAGVFSQALRCTPGSAQPGCTRGLITNDADEQYTDHHVEQQRPPPLLSGPERHTQGALRRHREHGSWRTTPQQHQQHQQHQHQQHVSLQPSQPGVVTARGFPNTLIQAERARRHLPLAVNTKRGKRKPRVGSFSLIINNNPSAPLQISRARRQVKTEAPQRGKSTRSGAYSVLGDPQADGQTDRARRSVTE